MEDIVNKFTSHLKNVLTRALALVVESGGETIEPIHLLWSLTSQKGSIGAELLLKEAVTVEQIRPVLPLAQGQDPSSATLSPTAKHALEKAVLVAHLHNHRYIGTEHLVYGLLQITDSGLQTFFAQQKTNLPHLKQQVETVLKSTSRFPDLANSSQEQGSIESQTTTRPTEDKQEKASALEFFAYEMTSKAAQTRMDPVIGRECEIERVMQILCRRTKNNPILLGEPGVGKTAIVEGLAQRIVQGMVPEPLQNKRLFALDLSLVVAGTMYRGEFENRIKQIVEEVKQDDRIMLFIDEIHGLVGAGSASGSMDAATMLKPALARGEIRCIGATTPAEYKKHFETDAALERRFCPVNVAEPTTDVTLQILAGVRPSYEAYHRVHISDEALASAVRLSERYVQGKQQPDKALDLLDEAAAGSRLLRHGSPLAAKRRDLEEQLTEVQKKKSQAVKEEKFEEAGLLKQQEQNIITALSTLTEQPPEHAMGSIGENDVIAVTAKITGIPLNEIATSEQRLKKLEEHLGRHVLGQDEAVRTVAAAMRRAKTGIADPKRPLASFLFVGPSGVGKTELARAIAAEVFQDPKALIRLDMSEFAEGFAVSKLVGAPAGYVGYRESTKLTDQIKQKPHAVVLFDELEKAHKDVLNLLLQILEQGEITDATGRVISFKNAVVVMTSNAGLERLERGEIGFGDAASRPTITMNQDLRRELEESFRPEMLNRIDAICLFQPLQKDTLRAISEKMLTELADRLQKEHIDLHIDTTIAEILSTKSNPKFGARDLRRLIQTDLESPIADLLLGAKRPLKLNIEAKRDTITVKKVK